MLLPRTGALLLTASIVRAYKDTSPFFLLSSEPLNPDAPLQSTQIATTEQVSKRLIDTLGECDKKWYYIFSQQHVTVEDTGNLPKTLKTINAAMPGQVVEIPDVGMTGAMNGEDIGERIQQACSEKGRWRTDSWPEEEGSYSIVNMDLPELPTDQLARQKVMIDTDDALVDTVSSVLDKENLAVLIYVTTPPARASHAHQDDVYEMDEPYLSALHTELKRDLDMHKRQSDDSNMQAGLPLFETYQFLSPPIFMGLSVSLLLFIIAYVGVTAISGLQVSYMAFSKEMGPKTQKA